jgi:tRNA dimethylallyltransferase
MTKELPKILVIVGPTASGKTAISMELANRMNAEIVSADSRQIYRYMDIGTAKPTSKQLAQAPHHFIDILAPDEEYNAGRYGKEGREVIDDILSRGKLPLVVGGSGLYIKSLIDGFFEGPPADKEFRSELLELLKAKGGEVFLEELRKVDPASASKMHASNSRRIIRALEVYHLTGQPISAHHKEKINIHFRSCLVYKRIDERVDGMLKEGLLEEAREIQRRGYSPELNALRTLGYKEAYDYLREKISYEEMARLMKQNTRRYAKRQLTWFRGDKRIFWVVRNTEGGVSGLAESILERYQKY